MCDRRMPVELKAKSSKQSSDQRWRMVQNKEERWEQTKFSRNEDVEMGKSEDQVGPHQKWRHQEGGTRKTCWNFPGKQKTKVVWPLLEATTQPHLCEIAKTRGFWEKGAEADRKRDGGTTYRETWRNTNWLKTWHKTENTGWLKCWPALHKEMVKKYEREKWESYLFLIFEVVVFSCFFIQLC